MDTMGEPPQNPVLFVGGTDVLYSKSPEITNRSQLAVMRSAVRSRLSPPKQKVIPEGMAFLFWLGIRGARSAVVRPNAFLRRKSAAFSACNAENIRKCNRHGGGAAAGVSRLSFHFLFSNNECIFAVMRPDPDLTQTGAKLLPKSRTK